MNDQKICFKKVDYELSGLLHDINIGDLGLPGLQRPFVWSNTKVRDLLDSMYKGFPVGYFLFWETPVANKIKPIGIDEKGHKIPARLIVDGQQRLTSLYAVFRDKKVQDNDYQDRQIKIAFHPHDGRFQVADAAISKDPEWIPNISALFSPEKAPFSLVCDFLDNLKAQKGELSEENKNQIGHNLDRLFQLQKYPFTALEIAADVDEEQVSDIFVRINSQGVGLNQADFLLTLLSVFWDEGRSELERFCYEAHHPILNGNKPSPFNYFIKPSPDQLLRVSVALGFNRGRLKSVYHVLRGKDIENEQLSTEKRDRQFEILREAQSGVLNLTNWHEFMKTLLEAGYRSKKQISSESALLYSYSFFLIGRKHYQIPIPRLQRIIGRWFFFSSLTGRYTNSPETAMDGDLNRIKEIRDGEEFIQVLDELMNNELTHDYWSITLPAAMESSNSRNPGYLAYLTAQSCLNAPVLFSHKKIRDLLDPMLKAPKAALEHHHLFPKGWHQKQGEKDKKVTNQIANYALLEWPDNIAIKDDSPKEYINKIQNRFNDQDWQHMHELHALPKNWCGMDYTNFLIERRKLMSDIVRRGYETLK